MEFDSELSAPPKQASAPDESSFPAAESPEVETSEVETPQSATTEAFTTEIATSDLDAILHAAASGDERAFTELYRAVQPGMFRYARVLVGADADEVCAEAWLGIARDLRTFRGDFAAFKGWSARIVRNRAIDWGRANARQMTVSLDVLGEPDRPGTNSTSDDAVEIAATEAALRLIASLPRDQAEAVFLRSVVGMDAVMAGSVLGKSAGAVRIAAHRGLRTLGERLRRSSTGPPETAGNTSAHPDAQGTPCETDPEAHRTPTTSPNSFEPPPRPQHSTS